MRHRALLMHLARGAALVALALTVGAWVWSLQHCLIWEAPGGTVGLVILPQCVAVGVGIRNPPSPSSVTIMDATGWQNEHWPAVGRLPGTTFGLRLPFWLVAPLVAASTIWLLRWRPATPRPGHCRGCGYNLTGNTSGRCPECGVVFVTVAR